MLSMYTFEKHIDIIWTEMAGLQIMLYLKKQKNKTNKTQAIVIDAKNAGC